jgi:hypothetical protein
MRFLIWLYGQMQIGLDMAICLLMDGWDAFMGGDDQPQCHAGKWTRPARLAAASIK